MGKGVTCKKARSGAEQCRYLLRSMTSHSGCGHSVPLPENPSASNTWPFETQLHSPESHHQVNATLTSDMDPSIANNPWPSMQQWLYSRSGTKD